MVDAKYLTFDEYLNLGGTLEEAPFSIYEYRAEKKVDLYTCNRFAKAKEYPSELKQCVFNLIPLFESDNNILSEKIGDYSITKKDRKQIENDIKDIIKDCLSYVVIEDVPVLYVGADEN